MFAALSMAWTSSAQVDGPASVGAEAAPAVAVFILPPFIQMGEIRRIQNFVAHLWPNSGQHHIRLIFTENPNVLYIVSVPAEFDPKKVVTNLKNRGIFLIVRKGGGPQ
jgi:hypothetical protein